MAKYFIQGQGPITITDGKFHAKGGQGSVYVDGLTAIKIYTHPSSMIPVAKIKELSVLTSPKVIKPEAVVMDGKNNPVGYTMRFVSNAVAMTRLFPQKFKDRNKLSVDRIFSLILDMRQTVQHIHDNKVLIVDFSEMNCLVDSNYTEVYFIDADSYQTPSYPAQAITPSIRDFHAKKFDANSDWYSFAINAFRLLFDIHPFDGTHPKMMDREARMKANYSIARDGVTIPSFVPPFSICPPIWWAWFTSEFDKGERNAPPTDVVAAPVVIFEVKKVKGTEQFEIKEVKVYASDVLDYLAIGGVRVTVTSKGIYESKANAVDPCGDTTVGVTPRLNHVIAASIVEGKLKLRDSTKRQDIDCDIAAESLMSYDGRIYFKQSGTVSELQFTEMMNRIMVIPRPVANVHETATQLFDGVAVQRLFSSFFVSVFPNADEHYPIQINELDGQVIDAKYDNRVLMVVMTKGGKYHRHVIRFAPDFRSYDHKVVNDVQYVGLNFVVIDKGICAFINEKEEFVLFTNRKDDTGEKVVVDPAIKGNMRLLKDGNNVMFASGDTLYSIKMK